MFLLRQAQQARPNQRAVREIEGMKRFVLNQYRVRFLLSGLRELPQIVECQRHDQLRRNDLHVSTVDSGEGRAQNFVASHDFVDASLQDLPRRPATSAGAHKGY